MKHLCFMTIVATALLAGCSGSIDTPTSATTTADTIILFSGTLQPRATRFYSYTLTTGGTVSAMLASLERNGAPVSNTLELGLGIPAGTGCATQTSAKTVTSLEPQLRQDAGIGTYCVRIADVDGLPGPMNFTIRVIHP